MISEVGKGSATGRFNDSSQGPRSTRVGPTQLGEHGIGGWISTGDLRLWFQCPFRGLESRIGGRPLSKGCPISGVAALADCSKGQL